MKLEYISTTFPDKTRNTRETQVPFVDDNGQERQVINLHPDVEFQTFEGFGGAFTDSAGYVYAQMDQEKRERMLSSYFGAGRMNYRLGRIHADSCDFSVDQYEAMSAPEDRALTSFTLNRTRQYMIPMVKDAEKALAAPLELMLSPWSPPAFMKTNRERCHGGKLKPEYQDFWADYLCRYIQELRAEGLNVCRMSIQNEPNAVQTWDSCIYSPEEERDFLKNHLHPALVRHGLEDVEVFIWDHNKERLYERACVILDKETAPMVAGLAFHWYSGDHFEALELVRKRFPDKKLILSEACIEYSIYDKENGLFNAQKYAHDIIGNLNAGMCAFYDWNLVLDETGGPNHVGNLCDAPYLYDAAKKELIERNTLAYLWHFSHFILPGAVRIGLSRYTTRLDVTAFKNPDGSLVCVLMNQEDDEKTAFLRLSGQLAEIHLPPRSIGTVIVQTED